VKHDGIALYATELGVASLMGAQAIRGMAMPRTGWRFWTLGGRGMKPIIALAVLMSVTPALADNIYLTESGTCATDYVRDGPPAASLREALRAVCSDLGAHHQCGRR
jgi:hypothetical protein